MAENNKQPHSLNLIESKITIQFRGENKRVINSRTGYKSSNFLKFDVWNFTEILEWLKYEKSLVVWNLNAEIIFEKSRNLPTF
jgi:hypothetical protein